MNTLSYRIIQGAFKQRKILDLSTELFYSQRHLRYLCKLIFGLRYKDLRSLSLWANILRLHRSNTSTFEIATKFFKGDTANLYKFVRKFSSVPLTQIKGDHYYMPIKEVETLEKLSKFTGSGKNLTLKQLNIDKKVILSLRRRGFQIISVPGRYNGGYNLSSSSKSSCLKWINNIRKNRFSLTTNFTF